MRACAGGLRKERRQTQLLLCALGAMPHCCVSELPECVSEVQWLVFCIENQMKEFFDDEGYDQDTTFGPSHEKPVTKGETVERKSYENYLKNGLFAHVRINICGKTVFQVILVTLSPHSPPFGWWFFV